VPAGPRYIAGSQVPTRFDPLRFNPPRFDPPGVEGATGLAVLLAFPVAAAPLAFPVAAVLLAFPVAVAPLADRAAAAAPLAALAALRRVRRCAGSITERTKARTWRRLRLERMRHLWVRQQSGW
jgi:hypothetical protein